MRISDWSSDVCSSDLITSLNDVIIPKLKELFTLNYTQAMLVQFCFFTAYLVIGIPGAKLVKKIGYMRGAVAGLLTMLVGCLLFIPASQNAIYELFLLALFVLASGVDRKSTRLNSSHYCASRMPSSA